MVSKFNCKTKAFLNHILLASLEKSVLRESGTHNKTCLARWKNSAFMVWAVLQDTSEYICSELCLVVQSITVYDSRSDMSNSLWCQAMLPPRLFFPWNSPGKNTGVVCHSLFWLSRPGIEPGSPALQRGKPYNCVCVCVCVFIYRFVSACPTNYRLIREYQNHAKVGIKYKHSKWWEFTSVWRAIRNSENIQTISTEVFQ